MYVQEHNIEQQNHVNIAWFHSFTFTGKGLRKGWRTPLNKVKYREQRDKEKERSRGPFASERGDEPRSGIPYCSVYSYTYFGAKYMDHELMTMWLSVDPLADKYPRISPYAYCAWNPVKLVDPNGREWDPSALTQEQQNKLNKSVTYLCETSSIFKEVYNTLTKSEVVYKLQIGPTQDNHPAQYDGSDRWLVSPSLFLMFRVPRCRLFDSAVLGSLSGLAEEGEEDLELAG